MESSQNSSLVMDSLRFFVTTLYVRRPERAACVYSGNAQSLKGAANEAVCKLRATMPVHKKALNSFRKNIPPMVN